MNHTSLDLHQLSRHGALAVRVPSGNPDHHLWNNRGTWWCHFTWHGSDYTARRFRVSLQTPDRDLARRRRDQLFSRLQAEDSAAA